MSGFFATFGSAQPVVGGNQTPQRIKCETMGADLKEGSL